MCIYIYIHKYTFLNRQWVKKPLSSGDLKDDISLEPCVPALPGSMEIYLQEQIM